MTQNLNPYILAFAIGAMLFAFLGFTASVTNVGKLILISDQLESVETNVTGILEKSAEAAKEEAKNQRELIAAVSTRSNRLESMCQQLAGRTGHFFWTVSYDLKKDDFKCSMSNDPKCNTCGGYFYYFGEGTTVSEMLRQMNKSKRLGR